MVGTIAGIPGIIPRSRGHVTGLISCVCAHMEMCPYWGGEWGNLVGLWIVESLEFPAHYFGEHCKVYEHGSPAK